MARVLSFREVSAKFAPEVHDLYDLSNAVYHGGMKPVTGLVCPRHGPFQQYPAQLRRPDGSWCPSCGGEVRAAKRRNSIEKVLANFRKVHGDRYDYSAMVYQNGISNISVGCAVHGPFNILPSNHLKGQGCPACGALIRGRPKSNASRLKTAETKLAQHGASFEAESRKIHGDDYDYSQVDYKGRRVPVTIICKEHGPFVQAPGHHLSRAHGCPQCSHHRSKGEATIRDFLAMFGEAQTRNRTLVAPKEIDIYMPEAKLAVEYCGEYWHSARNPEDEREYVGRHADKMLACRELGVRLITLYESEWLARPATIKRLLRSAVGAARGAVMARKCEIAAVTPADAAAFYDKYHVQGAGGWGQHYGLYLREKLVACMSFAFGANDRGATREPVWTLTRYATRVAAKGGASRLFAAFVAEHEPETVKSFSDNRFFAGGMYEALGFDLEDESAPDYMVWHQRLGLQHKTRWQRKRIPARLKELGIAEPYDPRSDPRSERTMTYLAGARRVYDCGKKRWLWTNPNKH